MRGVIMNRIFVYGTIKSGQPLHFMLSDAGGEERCRLVGRGCTKTKWPLVIASEYNIPYLLDAEGEGHNIKGEVYAIDDDMMAKLDDLEGYPDVYDRRKIDIVMDDATTTTTTTEETDDEHPMRDVECWLYLLPGPSPDMMNRERFEEYDSYGAHGKPYIPIYDKEKGWLNELTSPSQKTNGENDS